MVWHAPKQENNFKVHCSQLHKVIHPKYYKHLKKGAHQSHLGRQKMGWFSGRLACTSSKTEICIKQNRNLDCNPEFSG